MKSREKLLEIPKFTYNKSPSFKKMTDFSKMSDSLKEIRGKKNHIKENRISLPWKQNLLLGRAVFLLLMYIFRAPSNLCQDKANQKMILRSMP